jgi:hypothetical protein
MQHRGVNRHRNINQQKMAILLVYIPVAIDATVLHVAAPTLSVALGSSGNELVPQC